MAKTLSIIMQYHRSKTPGATYFFTLVTHQGKMTSSRQQKGEKVIWQRRFWEHQIRNDSDFVHHVEYIHYNPVHHGLVSSPKDWQYSSFLRYVEASVYDLMWGASERLLSHENIGKE